MDFCLEMEATEIKSTGRNVKLTLPAQKTKEGAGFIVARSIGSRKLSEFDPFLLLDHFGPTTYKPGEAVGAPWHPHRGFETVTYSLQGEFQHQDSMGNKGILRAGDVQWMTAGSGIIHDEEPSKAVKEKGGTVEGFQLWVNLPAKHKMCDPFYQDVPKTKIPQFQKDNFFVKVIAGEAFGVKAAVNTTVKIHYLDFHAQKGAQFTHSIPSDMNACVYIYRGSAKFGKTEKVGQTNDLLLLDNEGTDLTVTVDNEEGVKFLLLAGTPIGEPVVRHGPFVMNTQQEIRQAFTDYQEGKLVKQKAQFGSKAEHDTDFNPDDASIV